MLSGLEGLKNPAMRDLCRLLEEKQFSALIMGGCSTTNEAGVNVGMWNSYGVMLFACTVVDVRSTRAAR